MSGEDQLARLLRLARELPPAQLELLGTIAEKMNREVIQEVHETSDIATHVFCSTFLASLLLYHIWTEAPFSKVTFETIFRDACRSAGWTADIANSRTFPGADVVVNGVPISLKTEAALDIKVDTLHISKFREARFIQQVAGSKEKLVALLKEKMLEHLDQYERIITLRAHRSTGSILYELVEIPRDLLRAVGTLSVDDFSPLTTQGGTTARVSWRGKPAFTVRVDGSDGKITLTSIQKSLCTVHVTWQVPFGLGAQPVTELLLTPP